MRRSVHAIVVSSCLVASSASAATLHVDVQSSTCSDAATYTQAQDPSTPLCTLQPAAAIVNAGDTVEVHAGTYPLATTLSIARSGNTAARIVFHATGAVTIVGPSSTGAQGVIVTGDYVTIDGFEIRDSNETGLRCSGCSYAVFRNNRVHDNGRGCSATTKCGQGIAANSAASVGVVIENNLSYDNGSGTSLDHCYYIAGHSVVVRNNVAARCAGYGFQIYPDCVDCDVVNNVAYGMAVQSGFVLGGEAPATLSTNMRVFNNLAIDNARYGFVAYNNASAGIAFANNLGFGNPRGVIGSTGGTIYTETGTITGDPLLVDPTLLDFHLRAGSPAIDVGSSVLFAPTDLDGESRPLGAGVDIGVDEYSTVPHGDGPASSSDAGTGGDPSASGCGCETRSRSSQFPVWCALAWLVHRRIRARPRRRG